MPSIRLLCLAPLIAAGAIEAAAAQSSATLYADGHVVVRQSLARRLPAGTTTISIPLGQADPTTLIALDPGVSVLGVRFSGAESDSSLLQRSVGRRVKVLRPTRDTVTVTVLSANPVRLELPSGDVVLGLAGQFLYPRDLVGSHDSAQVTIAAARPVDGLRLAYRAFGAWWRARYIVRLGGPSVNAGIAGNALLVSEALNLDSAEVHLFAGQIGTPTPFRSPRGLEFEEIVSAATLRASAVRPNEPAGESIGSHRIYTLPGRYRISPGETVVAPLFQPVTTRVERFHLVDGTQLGFPSLNMPSQEVAVVIEFRAERAKGSEFGERSLPGGTVWIYDGSAGRETLIGEGRLKDLSPNMPFVVSAGRAFDVRASRSTSGYQVVQDSVVHPNGSVVVRGTAQIQTFEWTLTNSTDSSITAEVSERRTSKTRIVQSSIAADTAEGMFRFRVTVPKREETKVSYRLRLDP